MKTLFRNTSKAQEKVFVPKHNDGSKFPLLALIDGGWLGVVADSFEEIMTEIISGYNDMPECDDDPGIITRHDARCNAIRLVQARAQGAILAEHATSDLSPYEKKLLTEGGEQLQKLTSWSSPVPIVLVADYYAPYTAIPRPVADAETDNIVWLDASTDETFLISLASVGEIALMRPKEAP